MEQRGHCKSRGLFFFLYGKGNENHLVVGMCCFVHDTVVSAVMRGVFVGDTMSYIGMRGHLCNIVF